MKESVLGSLFFAIVLTQSISMAQAVERVWIDTDIAIGQAFKDPDDGMAVLQALASPELSVVGISTVRGNADAPASAQIAREMLDRFGYDSVPVFEGANEASRPETVAANKATEAMAHALQAGPLKILVLGPATNVAILVRTHPELASRITEVVGMAGREKGQRIHVGWKAVSDFNFEWDVEAYKTLFATQIPLTLITYSASSSFWLYPTDLDALKKGEIPAQWLADKLGPWMAFWHSLLAPGMHPWDTVAVGWIASSHLVQCEERPAEIGRGVDDTNFISWKSYLWADRKLKQGRIVTACFGTSPGFKDDLVSRVSVLKSLKNP